MKNFKISFFVILLCVFLAGCAALKGSKSTDNSALTGGIDHAGYPNAYLERIAGESIADLLSKRIVSKRGGRFSVVGIEPLDGTNAHGVDAEFLSKKIRISLLHSGKAVVTDAPSKDELVFSNDGVSHGYHAVESGSIYAPDYILVGKILSQSPAAANDGKAGSKKSRNLNSAAKNSTAQASESLLLELSMIDTRNNKSVWKYKKALQKQI